VLRPELPSSLGWAVNQALEKDPHGGALSRGYAMMLRVGLEASERGKPASYLIMLSVRG